MKTADFRTKDRNVRKSAQMREKFAQKTNLLKRPMGKILKNWLTSQVSSRYPPNQETEEQEWLVRIPRLADFAAERHSGAGTKKERKDHKMNIIKREGIIGHFFGSKVDEKKKKNLKEPLKAGYRLRRWWWSPTATWPDIPTDFSPEPGNRAIYPSLSCTSSLRPASCREQFPARIVGHPPATLDDSHPAMGEENGKKRPKWHSKNLPPQSMKNGLWEALWKNDKMANRLGNPFGVQWNDTQLFHDWYGLPVLLPVEGVKESHEIQ